MDYRHFNGDSPLQDATQDFVVVNNQLHDEFDRFKINELTPHCSYLPMTELLEYSCLSEHTDFLKTAKYGKVYLRLQSEQIDILVEWAYGMRTRYKTEHQSIFEARIIEVMAVKSDGKVIVSPHIN